ncbi:MAG TPA: TlpA disulfide reductase family protein [Sphingobacteriaceae bacterium]|nr:TlpA disulfide reductase family protein [Sphingobacteriaceae bacterium]
MKNIIVIIATIFLLGSCTNKDQFVLNGTINNAGNLKKVYLYEGNSIVDSAFLNESNEFRFRRGAIEPRFYTLDAGEMQYIFILQNGEKVTFETDYAKDPHLYTVSGSDISKKVQALSAIRNKYEALSTQIEEEFASKVQANPESEDLIREESYAKFQNMLENSGRETLAFANENRDNLAGFYAMLSLDPSMYETQMIEYADEIRDRFASNSAVQSFVNHMAELKVLSVGQKAPDFESIDPNGKVVKLSDFKGKYTLLDFWASWCAPCRQENPNIVEQYERFKDKNFTVFGVSLDDSRSAWLKGIKDDNLNWIQVSDLQRWNSEPAQLYKINAIPASFLIGPDGTILAKNLRGKALGEFLEQHLND